jgi:hypothetical protein
VAAIPAVSPIPAVQPIPAVAPAGAVALKSIDDENAAHYRDSHEHRFMTDPVMTPTGLYFDRAQILHSIEETGQDPLDGTDIAEADLKEQPELKAQIEAYLLAHPERRGT